MSVPVYPREGGTYPDANGVPITAAGAIVEETVYIARAVRDQKLFYTDPLGIYQPEDRTGGGGTIVGGRTFGSFAALGAAVGLLPGEAVELLGYYAPGDGGGGTFYWEALSGTPADGGTVAGAGPLGRWKRSVKDDVNCKWFGASPGSTGAVNKQAIQAAIDYDIQTARTGTVRIPGGRYEIGDTIHLGYGAPVGFPLNTITLEGTGNKVVDESPFGGTMIVANFSDRPAIAVSGARASKIKKLSIFGRNREWIESRALGVGSSVYPSNAATDWLDPTLAATANSRYAPYAGVAIDPYGGSAPSPAYPDVNFPPFMAGTSQYNKTPSSDVKLEEVTISGFVVALVAKPCDSDGNGDFISVRESLFTHNIYCISTGHTQCRLVNADNTLFMRFHTGIVNTVHGKQQGKVSGEFSNCLFEACQQWIDLPDATHAGPIKFTNCYSEECWRIGRYANASNNNLPLVFETCQWFFSLQDDTVRGSPAYTLDTTGVTPVAFNGCSFGLYKSVLVFGGSMESYAFSDCAFEGSNSRTNPYEKIAHNFTANGVMFAPYYAARPRVFSGKTVTRYNAVTGATDDNRLVRSPIISDRTLNIPAWCTSVTPKSAPGKLYDTSPIAWMAVDKSLVTSSVLGVTLTVSGFSHIPQLAGGAPGDVIYDSTTGTTFFVRSLSGGTITAVAQNNIKSSALITAYTTTSGILWMGNARVYTPQFYLRGTLAASTTVSSVARPDGFAGSLAGWLANGDYALNKSQVLDDFTWYPTLSGCTLSSVTNGSPGSFAVGANPVATGVRDMDFFVLQPPANV